MTGDLLAPLGALLEFWRQLRDFVPSKLKRIHSFLLKQVLGGGGIDTTADIPQEGSTCPSFSSVVKVENICFVLFD